MKPRGRTASGDRHVRIREAGGEIVGQLRRLDVADEDEDHPLRLADGVTLDLELAYESAVRVGQDLHEAAVSKAVRESVVPAGDGVGRVTFELRRELDAPMRAAILDRAHLAVDTPDQDLLTEHRDRLRVPALELVAEERGVPVVAEPELRFEIGARRLFAAFANRFHAFSYALARNQPATSENSSGFSIIAQCPQWGMR
jgi:hypothetical protein